MGYRIWAEVWNATETIGYGIVNLAGLTVERRLDGIGSIRLELPVQDPNAQYLAIGRVLRCYTTHPHGVKRHVTTAILQKSSLRITAAGDSIAWEAFDRLEELRRLTTYLGRNYNGYELQNAVRDLMALAPTWTVSLPGVEGATSIRFDGTQVINALQTFAEVHGYHFRLGEMDRQLVFGAFGDDSGIRATNSRQQANTIDATGDVYLFDRLDLISDGGEIVNWIQPLIGQNEAFIDVGIWANEAGGIGGIIPDIFYSTSTILDANGNSIYYLTDTTSVTAYGQRQKVLLTNRIFGATSAFDASAMLFLWAQNWLIRHKDPQTAYRISLAKWSDRLQPGDLITVVYRGEIYQNGEKVRYANINAALWVMKMTERYSINGASLDLEVSTVDLFPADPVDVLADAIETQSRRIVSPEMRLQKTTHTATETVNNTTPGELIFELSGEALAVARANFSVTRANTTTAPDTLEITVNGSVVSGGPYLNGPGSGLSAGVNLKPYMSNSGTTTYTIGVACLYGSGDLNLQVDVFEIVGSIT